MSSLSPWGWSMNGNASRAWDSYDPEEQLKLIAQAARGRRTELSGAAIMKSLADVEPQPVRWLWPGRIPLGKLTLLVGDPGLGKSILTLDLAARVSTGSDWPDGAGAKPGGVILLSAEDNLNDTVRPRLDAAGADVSRIEAVTAVILPLSEGGMQHSFNFSEDLPKLEMAIGDMPDCKLVIVDPITAYLGATDSHRNAEVRGLLAPLSEAAAKYNVAVVAVSHLRKAEGPAIYRTMGSLAFVAAARAAYAVGRDKQDPSGERRLLLPIKNNLGNDGAGLAFCLSSSEDDGKPHVVWEPQPVIASVDDLLSGHTGSANQRGTGPAVGNAKDWLLGVLASGPVAASAVYARAEEEEISNSTLDRAKRMLGVTSVRVGGVGSDGHWMWKLPNAPKRH